MVLIIITKPYQKKIKKGGPKNVQIFDFKVVPKFGSNFQNFFRNLLCSNSCHFPLYNYFISPSLIIYSFLYPARVAIIVKDDWTKLPGGS